MYNCIFIIIASLLCYDHGLCNQLLTEVVDEANNSVSDQDVSGEDSYCPSWCNPLKCTSGAPLLRLGHCLTFEEGKGISTARCPYFQQTEHITTKLGYIVLPRNISKLNDYMCKSMNRKGFLCKDCIDGFGPSVTSVGYICSNCSTIWYGIPLFLLVELLPVTAFYILILVLPIRLTTSPMTCFIMYSQFIVLEIIIERKLPVDLFPPTNPLLRVVLVVYGIWNLDFFRYVLPPFCVNSNLQLVHIYLLGYVSIIFPILLIVISWICVEIHDHNCQPLVCLCKPLHRVFIKVQRVIKVKHDIIDVFAAFMVLSYSKMVYQSYALMKCTTISNCSSEYETTQDHVMMLDMNIRCGSAEHVLIAIPVLITAFVLSVIPMIILAFYPVKIFRKCMAKFKLNKLALLAFIERFHGCYKDGLNGSRDMRSFSGFYFLLRCLLPALAAILHKILYKAHVHIWEFRGVLFSIAALLTAYSQPYKEKYMNVLDTLLLAHLSIVCHLLARNWFSGADTQILIVALIPALVLGVVVVIILCWKSKNRLLGCCQIKKKQVLVDNIVADDDVRLALNKPTSSTISSFKTYGSVH